MSKLKSIVPIKVHELFLNDSDLDTPDKKQGKKICQE